jgi:hypothetical protein
MLRIKTLQRGCFPFLYFFVFFVSLWSASQAGVGAEEPTYWKDIQPILRKNCTVCHNAKNLKEFDVSGGLALDSYEVVLKGKHGRVVHAKDSTQSLLVKMITTTEETNRTPRNAPALHQ